MPVLLTFDPQGLGIATIWNRAKEKYEETRSSHIRSLIADYVKNGALTDIRTLQDKLLASGIDFDEASECTYADNADGRLLRKVHGEMVDKELGTA